MVVLRRRAERGGHAWGRGSLDLQFPAFSFDWREAVFFTRHWLNNRGRILRCDLLFSSQLCSSSAPISVCSQNGAGESMPMPHEVCIFYEAVTILFQVQREVLGTIELCKNELRVVRMSCSG